jgi:hypothetical protein
MSRCVATSAAVRIPTSRKRLNRSFRPCAWLSWGTCPAWRGNPAKGRYLPTFSQAIDGREGVGWRQPGLRERRRQGHSERARGTTLDPCQLHFILSTLHLEVRQPSGLARPCDECILHGERQRDLLGRHRLHEDVSDGQIEIASGHALTGWFPAGNARALTARVRHAPRSLLHLFLVYLRCSYHVMFCLAIR